MSCITIYKGKEYSSRQELQEYLEREEALLRGDIIENPKLFSSISSLLGDNMKIEAYSQIYTDEFLKNFGDWRSYKAVKDYLSVNTQYDSFSFFESPTTRVYFSDDNYIIEKDGQTYIGNLYTVGDTNYLVIKPYEVSEVIGADVTDEFVENLNTIEVIESNKPFPVSDLELPENFDFYLDANGFPKATKKGFTSDSVNFIPFLEDDKAGILSYITPPSTGALSPINTDVVQTKDGYEDADGNPLEAVTKVLKKMQGLQSSEAEQAIKERVDKLFANLREGETLLIQGQELNKQEVEEFLLKQNKMARVNGELLHLYMAYQLETDTTRKDQYKAEYDNLINTYAVPDYALWFSNDQSMEKIKRDYLNITESSSDKIIVEYIVSSKLLGIAGRADLIKDHGNNIYSIYDLKTGAFFKQKNSLFKYIYGDTPYGDVNISPSDNAKMQIMLYALLVKIENPDAKFRELRAIHIANSYELDNPGKDGFVNVPKYLYAIERYLKYEMPDKYAELAKLPHFNSLFDPTEYDVSLAHDMRANSTDNVDTLISIKSIRLQRLVTAYPNIESRVLNSQGELKEHYTNILNEIKKLTEELIELRKYEGMSFIPGDSSLSWLDNYLGSATSSTNPYAQFYAKVLNEQRNKARKDFNEWDFKYRAVLKKLIDEQSPSALGESARGFISGPNIKKLFRPLIKKDLLNDSVRERLITKDDPEYSKLTKAQRNYVDFVNDSIAQFFVDEMSNHIDPSTGKPLALANRVVKTLFKGNTTIELTNLDVHNNNVKGDKLGAGFSYYAGFFPKYMPTIEDIKNSHGLFSSEMFNYLYLKYVTYFFESNYMNWGKDHEVIPMEGLGTPEIDADFNYTYDLDFAISNFMQHHYNKVHMDEVYTLVQGLKIYLNARDYGTDADDEKLVKYLDTSVKLHVLNQKQMDLEFFGRNIQISKVSKKNNNIYYTNFNITKALRSIKNMSAGPTMWLKFFSGTRNGLFASMLSYKEAAVNSMTKAFGDASFDTSYNAVDLSYGIARAQKIVGPLAVVNNLNKDKIWLLAKKFNYMPDNYDWFVSNNTLLTRRNKAFSTDTMYMFHSYPEEVIALGMFIAQMRHLKAPDGKSVLDHYKLVTKVDPKTGVESYDVEWDGTVRGVVKKTSLDGKAKYEDLTELSNEEIAKMKFVYEKVHGGYRGDERAVAEYYLFGEMVLQLKRYLPMLFRSVMQSKGVRYTQGSYKKIIDSEGKEVLQWTPAVIEGRWRIIAGQMMRMLNIKGFGKMSKANNYSKDMSEYAWDRLSPQQKADVIDFWMTMALWGLMLLGLSMIWDRDEKSPYKTFFLRLTNDIAGNASPFELLKNIKNLSTPVSVKYMWNLTSSLGTTTYSLLLYGAGMDDAALTKKGKLKGWTDLKKNIHILASIEEFTKFVDADDKMHRLK